MEKEAVGITPEQANEIREECKKTIARADALERLYSNPDFMFVMDHYLKEEAARLVHLLGDQVINMGDKKDKYRNDIHERLIGIARLAEFFRNVNSMADQAEKQLAEIKRAEAEYTLQ